MSTHGRPGLVLLRCEHVQDPKAGRCGAPASDFVQGRHVCAVHIPPATATGACTHALTIPGCRCPWCGADPETSPT